MALFNHFSKTEEMALLIDRLNKIVKVMVGVDDMVGVDNWRHSMRTKKIF